MVSTSVQSINIPHSHFSTLEGLYFCAESEMDGGGVKCSKWCSAVGSETNAKISGTWGSVDRGQKAEKIVQATLGFLPLHTSTRH